jgi:anti-anti-sigma factor
VLRIRQEKVDGVRVYRLDGVLTAVEAGTLKTEVREAIAGGDVVVDLDLADVELVDSTGLGALVAIHKSADGAGGRVTLKRLRSNVLAVLELTRLHRVLHVVSEGTSEALETSERP